MRSGTEIESVLVVGAGLIGGSIGLALRTRGIDVRIEDSSPGTTQLARELGVGEPLDEGETGISPFAPDLVVIATPPDVAGNAVLDCLERFPSAVVVDVASIKDPIARHVTSEGDRRGLDIGRYVGAHPMAGREVSGVVAARSDIFHGRPFVVAGHERSYEAALESARTLGRLLGASVIDVDPPTHDSAVAYVSHVPQLVSSLLASRLVEADDDALQLAGQGLRDTTRIAASDPRLWIEILHANAAAVAPVLRALYDDLGTIVGEFERNVSGETDAGLRASVARVIAGGNSGVARIPGKHGRGTDQFASITVLVPDEPGQLSALLVDMASADLNLEDLRLEHSLGQPVGLAHVSVARSDLDDLSVMLDARGWARAGRD